MFGATQKEQLWSTGVPNLNLILGVGHPKVCAFFHHLILVSYDISHKTLVGPYKYYVKHN